MFGYIFNGVYIGNIVLYKHGFNIPEYDLYWLLEWFYGGPKNSVNIRLKEKLLAS